MEEDHDSYNEMFSEEAIPLVEFNPKKNCKYTSFLASMLCAWEKFRSNSEFSVWHKWQSNWISAVN